MTATTIKSTTQEAAWVKWQAMKEQMIATSAERERNLTEAIRQARLQTKMRAKVRRP
jgi:hypothetical protein